MNGDGDLGRPTLILTRAHPPLRARSPVTDDLLVASDGGLNAAPFVVAGYRLPPDPAFLGNLLEMTVALGRLTRGRCTGSRRRSRRHDDGGLRLVVRHRTIDAILIVGAITGERRHVPGHLSKQRANLRGVIHVVRRRIGGTISPVSASIPMCNFRQARRVLVPCFSISHSPAPPSSNPVLSTSRCTGSARPPDRGWGTSSVSPRRLRVVWSGTGRSRPRRRMGAEDLIRAPTPQRTITSLRQIKSRWISRLSDCP
jgi:hypothetical protein